MQSNSYQALQVKNVNILDTVSSSKDGFRTDST